MFGPFQFLQVIASFAGEYLLDRHQLVRQEAGALIKRAGPSAFETAQQIALLARQRGDKRATKLWLDVAREIARRER
ncbi:hypothetical protein [Bosea sp. BIWAKO-01]|uniref:hypothetical protein n=1 Tax=Bosea sp. BIWAKO-01 TaxID=506668 RepID=UPI000853DF32|nr:hypothetical protein [Bosea sp. BIWAKO-01]